MNTENAITIEFVADIMEDWDNVEVHPCKDYPEGTEQCEPEEAEFWSVYLHMVAGGLCCIADLPTQELAETFADMVRNLAAKYKPEPVRERPFLFIQVVQAASKPEAEDKARNGIFDELHPYNGILATPEQISEKLNQA
jgi:hypothetical protein